MTIDELRNAVVFVWRELPNFRCELKARLVVTDVVTFTFDTDPRKQDAVLQEAKNIATENIMRFLFADQRVHIHDRIEAFLSASPHVVGERQRAASALMDAVKYTPPG